MRRIASSSENGFGLSEMLVSVFIFSLAILAASSFNTITFGNLGVENKISASVREVRNAVNLLSSELRMAANISPYIPGNSPELVNCTNMISASNTQIKFLVVHDDYSASNGIQPYYVGYSYDPVNHRLLRGEVSAPTTTNCLIPAADPISTQNAKTIADRVYQADIDNNGIYEPILSYANGILTVNLAIEAAGNNKLGRQQTISTKIYTRSSG